MFSVFLDTVYLAGWIVHPTAKLVSLALVAGQDVICSITSLGLSSPDVAQVHGEGAGHCRFWQSWTGKVAPGTITSASLRALFDDGRILLIDRPALTALQGDPVSRLITRFHADLAQRPAGQLLEIGSRARSGITRRHLVPPGWDYVGVDILPGRNVDLVCDAHELSEALDDESFGAFMCFSVFEHLLMPWKVVLELNAVLGPGALGIVTTHQAWPIHEQPWDFWRFSSDSWQALFNSATGFEIIDTAMGEPGFVVANYHHTITDFPHDSRVFLSSAVLFRRTGRTRLSWPVRTKDVTRTTYPTTISDSASHRASAMGSRQ